MFDGSAPEILILDIVMKFLPLKISYLFLVDNLLEFGILCVISEGLLKTTSRSGRKQVFAGACGGLLQVML